MTIKKGRNWTGEKCSVSVDGHFERKKKRSLKIIGSKIKIGRDDLYKDKKGRSWRKVAKNRNQIKIIEKMEA